MITAANVDRTAILGVQVSAVNLQTASDEIARWIDAKERQYVCVTGVHGLIESQSDPSLRRIHNSAGLVTPDGMPLVWLSKWYGKLRVAGGFSPPFRELKPEEASEISRIINHSGADIVWVGLSTPKQERWMSAFRPQLIAPVLIGVGAAFDFHAGRVRQAPRWIQRIGMEWFFRLCAEPRRLWRRYLRNNPLFIYLAAAQLLGIKRWPAGVVASDNSGSALQPGFGGGNEPR